MFGRTFAETFPFAYTRKYWTVEAASMSTDWVGKRMYPPKLEDVVRGALVAEQPGDFHYLSTFRYPSRGGYRSFMNAFAREEGVRTSSRVVEIDLRAKTIKCEDGSAAAYDELVSTMPLTELIASIVPSQVPDEVRAAAERLLCSSLVLVDVATTRRDLFDHHWFYVYDEEISFSRVHFPHMLAPANAPEGCGAIQVEVYHSQHRPLPCTPRGCVELLRRHDVPLDGAEVVVIGRGVTVGRPLGLLLTRKSENATVTLCHTGTKDLAAHARRADIVVVAAGRPALLTPDMVKPGAAVLDVGITRTDAGLVGDVHPDVRGVAGYLAPMPGGVGPMTRAMLLSNVVEAAERALG